MSSLASARLSCFAAVVLAAFSGCGPAGLRPLEETTVTLQPEKTASIWGEIRSDRFGVCTGVSRRGLRLYLWDEFLRQRADPRDYELEAMAGYQVSVFRGESCHERILNAFQAAARFDLSVLPSSAVTSARLVISKPFAPVDPPARGTREQCTVIRIGEATASWTAGIDEVNRRPFIPWRAARRDTGPYQTGLSGVLDLDVAHTVGAWARGQRPNEGFVVTPDMDHVTTVYDATDEGDIMCEMGISDFELVVTVATAR